MGSFIGHVDEAFFFLMLAAWWLFNTFPAYVKSGSQYRSQLSFGVSCCSRVPTEAILKILFPLCGFIGELANGHGPHFIDSEGNFQKLNGMQHMTIYGMFVLHGICDMLLYMRIRALPPNIDLWTGVLAFIWYALSFQYHARMPGKEPLETMIHILPTYIMFLVAALMLVMIWRPHIFLVDFSRIWCFMVLGTWFIHTSFMMYIPWGGEQNMEWNRSDHRNVHFVIAAFGAHIILNLIALITCYVITFCVVGRHTDQSQDGVEYKRCRDEECETLIDSC